MKDEKINADKKGLLTGICAWMANYYKNKNEGLTECRGCCEGC